MQNIKENIKNRLICALRNKFENYTPESNHMPFHTRLLGGDRIALYSFIHSLNTNFGTSIFEPVAQELSSSKFDTISRQAEAGDTITKESQRIIQDIMDALESGNSKPNKNKELSEILKVARNGETSKVKPTKIDLLLQKSNSVWLIDIKTASQIKAVLRNLSVLC